MCLCETGYGWDGENCVAGQYIAPDGTVCTDDSDCVSAYCNNNICCRSGDCCSSVADCPPESYSSVFICDDVEHCQGSAQLAVCHDNICTILDPIDDDSGCTVEMLVTECGNYAPIYCNGQEVQEEGTLICSSQCDNREDCAPGYSCVNQQCIQSKENGQACEGNEECTSNYCQAGLCCQEGECCLDPGYDEIRECGNCGIQSRLCSEGYFWTEWGECTGEGVCTPYESGPCDICGTAVCNEFCYWDVCDYGDLDDYEPNDSLSQAHYLAEIRDCDRDEFSISANINPSKNDDWYKVHVRDRFGCIVDPRVTLSNVPSGQAYRLCAWYKCDGDDSVFTDCVDVVSGGNSSVDFNPQCGGSDDAGHLEIQVDSQTPGSCSYYTLTIRG
jgi:hypothetical protein